MLRHAAGYALAARGVDTRTVQAFMGHRSIANTVVYTAVADKRIRNIWGKREGGCRHFYEQRRQEGQMDQARTERLREIIRFLESTHSEVHERTRALKRHPVGSNLERSNRFLVRGRRRY